MNALHTVKWYWITRGIGAITALYELLIDHSAERGTVILAAFGLMGFDWVAKREKSYESKDEKAELEADERNARRAD